MALMIGSLFVSRIAPAIAPTRLKDRKMPTTFIDSNTRKRQPPLTSDPNGEKHDNCPVGMTLSGNATQDLNVRLQSQLPWPTLPIGFIVFDATPFPRRWFPQEHTPEKRHESTAPVRREWLIHSSRASMLAGFSDSINGATIFSDCVNI